MLLHTMAPPFLVVDHAVQYFHYQWNCGVQPSLTLKTSADGSIEISTTVRSPIPDRPFHQQSHCSKSGQTSRARRRTKREQSFHQAAEVEVAIMQPHLVSNNKSNMEVLPKSLEEKAVQVNQSNENEEELSTNVSEILDAEVKVVVASELEKCRDHNLELCNKIELCDREIEKKEHLIRKLELEVSNLKFKAFKPPRKLSFANVQCTDIPPSFHRQASGHPV